MSKTRKLLKIAVVTPVVLVALMACAHMAMMKASPKPPANEFGYGPRTSAQGNYAVSIEAAAPFKPGRMFTSVISVRDARGNAVDGAQVDVDGGMPQHGHGLPTKPRVTKSLGNGRYQVEGLKFNMSGWWELKFAINTAAAMDSVTFNLEL